MISPYGYRRNAQLTILLTKTNDKNKDEDENDDDDNDDDDDESDATQQLWKTITLPAVTKTRPESKRDIKLKRDCDRTAKDCSPFFTHFPFCFVIFISSCSAFSLLFSLLFTFSS